jgi:hypothetical protein
MASLKIVNMEQTDLSSHLWECTHNHIPESNDPITLSKGEKVKLGKLAPEEKWKNWIWAENASLQGGWVPIQIIEYSTDRLQGVVLEDYSAKELDITKGEQVLIIKPLNGWNWVRKVCNNEEGWIPNEVLEINNQ